MIDAIFRFLDWLTARIFGDFAEAERQFPDWQLPRLFNRVYTRYDHSLPSDVSSTGEPRTQ